MPLQDSATLERSRVQYWKSRSGTGHPLTAFAVSVLDNQSPASKKGNKDYPYGGQMLLTHCLLDGHHRVQAASETDSPVRILTLLAPFASNVGSDFDFAMVLERLAAQVLGLNSTLMLLRDFALGSEQPSLALVLESEALAGDADDDRVVKDAIEHRHGEYAVAGEG